jgi:osmotically-inducible protein OsmY
LAAAVVLVIAAGAFLYHSRGAVNVSKLRSTVYAAGANVAGISPAAVGDADIQREVERKLALLKESSIQANVENGVVTLMGRAPSVWESLHAENVASQTNGVKRVKNEVEVGETQPSGSGKKTKSKAKK